MSDDYRIIVGMFDTGATYATTASDRTAAFPSNMDAGLVEIEEWNDKSHKAHLTADLAILILTAVGSGVLGSALSEAGKDLYALTKRGVLHLLRIKMKDTYRSNSKIYFIQLVDNSPVPVTLQLFQNIRCEEVPTEDEINEVFERQYGALNSQWPVIEARIRQLRSFHDTVSVVVHLNGQAAVEPGWKIPGWQPSTQVPWMVERINLPTMLHEWTPSGADHIPFKEQKKRLDRMGF